MKYSDWLDTWLDDYIRPTVKETTLNNYSRICKLHIKPALGDYDLGELSAIRLQGFVSDLLFGKNSDIWLGDLGKMANGTRVVKSFRNARDTHGGKGPRKSREYIWETPQPAGKRGAYSKASGKLSPNYVNVIITVIQSSLKAACLIGVTDRYEANKIRRPKLIRSAVNCFSLKEQLKIEAEVIRRGTPKYCGIILALYTGLRIGELLALKWEDLDIKRRTLTVNHTCHDEMVNGKRVKICTSPKTETSRRTIPIPRQIIPIIRRMRKNGSEYIVADNKKVVFIRTYQKFFSEMLARIGIPHRSFHALRHTFATRALECGMDVKTLSELLGHSSSVITLDRYAHSMMEHKTEMMNRLGRLRFPGDD